MARVRRWSVKTWAVLEHGTAQVGMRLVYWKCMKGVGDLEDETLSKGNERQRRTGGGTEGDNEYSNGWKEYDGVAEKQRKVRHLTPRCVGGNFDEKDKGGI